MAARKRQEANRPSAEPQGPSPTQPPAEQPEAATKDAGEDRDAPQTPKFPIVAIGASAGGLEALQEFFSHTPAETGIGFVVVTHQHPGHVSLLPDLLARVSSMRVVEAADGTVVEPNHVYVGTPGGLLAISGGMLRRLDTELENSPHLPIDSFFRSLAEDQREHAICIVLSGTGADGTLGMRTIKAESGMAMVQQPPSAKYAGMPSSAMATGLADYILPAADRPGQLIAYSRGPYLKNRTAAVPAPAFPKEPLQRIFSLLRARTNHDFASYKMNTIRRRIERRMNVHQIKEADEYVRYLQENPHEIDMLFSELLISVTSFFRDPPAFETLAERALPSLLGTRSDEHALRVWVPGCASGEEAYSIAILLHECMAKMKTRFDVQIFGTDLDSHAIDAARAGVYAAGISADVSKERLERYFVREDNAYRVAKEIREMLVFAPQNVIKDPPFTKLDLVVCRNMLIYLDGDAQRRLLPVFHYALRPNGLLFLGPSESIGRFADLFEPIDNKWKIFRKKETVSPMYPLMELLAEPGGTGHVGTLPRDPFAPIKQSHTMTSSERTSANSPNVDWSFRPWARHWITSSHRMLTQPTARRRARLRRADPRR
jgi:two-component system CheB/CheR fusion protein